MFALALLLAVVPDIKIDDTKITVDGKSIALGAHVLAVVPNPSRPIAAVFVSKHVEAEQRPFGVMPSDAVWLVDLTTRRKRRLPTADMGPPSWVEELWSPDGSWLVHPLGNYGPFAVMSVDELPKWIRSGGPIARVTAETPGPGKVHRFERWEGDGAIVILACCGTEDAYRLDPTKRTLTRR